jgi:hypothetical protein
MGIITFTNKIYLQVTSSNNQTTNTMKNQPNKQRKHVLISLLAISALGLNVCKGTLVFSDTFSQAPGTPVIGSTADVGGTWTGTGPNISPANTYDTTIPTTTGSYTAFNTFTSALGPGEILTLNYDTLVPSTGSGSVFTGWGGVSLFSGGTGGTEEVFTGNSAAGSWGTDGNSGFWDGPTTAPIQVNNHQNASGDSNVVNHIKFTYNFNTGAITFTTTNGAYSGTEEAGVVLNALRIGNGAGDQLNIDNLTVDISPIPVVTFTAVSPANGSYSASRTSVSLQAFDGSVPVNTNTIVMKVDGGTVTPVITKSTNVTTIIYVPGSPLSAGTLHTAQVTLADTNGALYTNAWSFTTAFQSLPSVLPGPIVASNQEVGIVIFSTNDAWLGTNYGPATGTTIYARFSINFNNLNGETGSGGGYGGLQFIYGGINGQQNVLAGNAWISTNWSIDPYPAPQTDLNPVTPIVFGQWHTIAERVDYTSGGNATVTVWLDPDFTQTEANQSNAPVVVSTTDNFDTIALRTGNGTASATFSNIVMATTLFAPPASPTFVNLVPAANDSVAPLASPISAKVVFGTYGVGTNTLTMTLDGNSVTPTFSNITTNSFTATYQPPSPFVAGSPHTVTVGVTDSNNTPYSTNWAFTVDPYPVLPVVQAGPFTATAGNDVVLWNSLNEWIGGNYGLTSTNTLYTRFSMTFYDLNGETGTGGGFGGLEFYLGNTEQFLIGNNWLSTNWSVSVATQSTADIPPVTPIVLGSWHTLVIKSVYTASTNTQEEVWLDPDFTQSEFNQPNAPLSLTCNNTFDNIHLRAGNGSAYDEFTNIVMAATAQGVGFAAAVPPGRLSIHNGQLSWTGGGTLQYAPAVTGPWTNSANQANPQVLSITNTAQFFRLRQ